MEFELIRQYFKTPFEPLLVQNESTCLVGIGDDCARLAPSVGHHMFMSTDTLESGVHFFGDVGPADLAWKCLAVSLSDLAACGATPLCFTLNLSMSTQKSEWLEAFSKSLLDIAIQFNCALVGGDTTSRAVSGGVGVVVTVIGQAAAHLTGFPRRAAALADDVWVSGLPGLARLGLCLESLERDSLAQVCSADSLASIQALLNALPLNLQQQARMALNRPVPRLDLGTSLHGVANACIDLSDGLSGDLQHITHASKKSIVLDVQAVQNLWLAWWPDALDYIDTLLAMSWVGGDDYELCFTAPEVLSHEVGYLSSRLSLPLTCVGRVSLSEDEHHHVFLKNSKDSQMRLDVVSYDHFKNE